MSSETESAQPIVCIVCRDEPVEEEGATCWRCEEIERQQDV